jgi:hypothetical protein
MENKVHLPECGMFVGSPVYLDRADYVFQHTGKYYTSWVAEDHDPEWYLAKAVEENQGNLLIIWDGSATKRCLKSMADWMDLKGLGLEVPEPDWENKKYLVPEDWKLIKDNKSRFGAGFLKFVEKASEKGLYSYGIYSEAEPQWIEKISRIEKFLGYNTGEKFSFDIEETEESDFREKKAIIEESHDLETITLNFKKSVRKFVEGKRKEGWKRFLITSASFHLDIEIAAAECEIIPHIECFAFRNINFASALCRGLYKQFNLPLWGNYLAHEHYSFLPYESEYKFKMLESAFWISYMSGSKITVLESGNWWQQSDHVEDTPMHDTPKIDTGGLHNNEPRLYAHLVKEARKHYGKLNYDSDVCRKYRKSLSDFYDFLKENGTPEGQPEINIAAIKGNMDLCSQSFHPNMAIAGAFKKAEKNPLWYEGMPERSWEIFRKVFYPLNNTFDKYVNGFFSGTPYGMTDIVSFAGEITSEFLIENYKALLFTGWNTASDSQYGILKDYVHAGGTLFIGIPHLSKNKTRNYVNYPVEDLVNNGDFSELCGVKVKGRGKQLYWMLAVENNILNLPRNKHFGPCLTHLGDIELTGNPEVIAVHDETFAPALILNRYGRGKVYFLNSWEHPGALDAHAGPSSEIESNGLVGEVYRRIAIDCSGTAFITDDGNAPGKNCEYITYSYFPSNRKLYLLNMDFSASHEFYLHRQGGKEKIKLKALEFRIV